MLHFEMMLALSAAVQAAAAHKPAPPAPTPLTLQVKPVDSYNIPAGILPDSFGDTYTDGSQGICASFDSYGNLIINFHCSRTPTTRNLWFDMSHHYAPASCNNGVFAVPPDPQSAGLPFVSYLSTVPPTDYPSQGAYIPLQSMAPGASQCIQLNISYTFQNKSETAYRLSYHRNSNNPAFPQIADTPYAVVTRVDSDSWNVEPDPLAACNAGKKDLNAAEIITTPDSGPFNFQNCGTYSIPFRFVLTAKQ
jgi:hypothetical protein